MPSSMLFRRNLKDWAKHVYYSFADEIRLLVSHFDDVSTCETVCICLGPYRNLTTLTASILFLHPVVQVLNHAGRRIFGDPRVDFLSEFSEETLRRFVRLAIRMSKHGERASWGGAILHSHAFDSEHSLGEIYRESELGRLKNDIKCLFWKESLRVSKHLRRSDEPLENIIQTNERVRFLMPVRNPMDCARSNMKTGHHVLFPDVDVESEQTEVLRAVLEEISWYAGLKRRYPNRFFHFFEDGLSESMLRDLADFLHLRADEEWIRRSLSVMDSKSNYNHSDDFRAFYADRIEHLSFPDESVRQGLRRFL